MARTQWVNLTDNDFTISAIHWAEDKVDADIEAAMMNTGQSTRSSSFVVLSAIDQVYLFQS